MYLYPSKATIEEMTKGELETEVCQLLIKLRDADEIAKAIDELVKRGALDARSLVADARLNYGTPYIYEFSKKD